MAHTFIDIALIVFMLSLTMLMIKRFVDYLVMKHLTAEETLYIHECSRSIRKALGIIYVPGPSNEKPFHVRRIEKHQRSIETLKSIAARRLIQRFSFS